jgi:hypothetical protein
MKCPYCFETVVSGALACKSCGRDVHLIAKLEDRISCLELELANLKNNIPSTPGESSPERPVSFLQFPHRLEIGAVIATAALLPFALYDLRSVFSLPAWTYFPAVVVCSGAAGFLIGNRGTYRKVAVFFCGICLAVLQTAATSLAFGYTYHLYYRGQATAHTIVWWASGIMHNYHLWIYETTPAAVLFILSAFVRRSMARPTPFHRGLISSSLSKYFTNGYPGERWAKFCDWLDRFEKVEKVFSNLAAIILAVLTIYYTVGGAKGVSLDPSTRVASAQSK